MSGVIVGSPPGYDIAANGGDTWANLNPMTNADSRNNGVSFDDTDYVGGPGFWTNRPGSPNQFVCTQEGVYVIRAHIDCDTGSPHAIAAVADLKYCSVWSLAVSGDWFSYPGTELERTTLTMGALGNPPQAVTTGGIDVSTPPSLCVTEEPTDSDPLWPSKISIASIHGGIDADPGAPWWLTWVFGARWVNFLRVQ